MADYQLIECHTKLPQPAVRFDREQFIYKEENAIFDNICNLSGRILLFLPSEFSTIDTHPFQVSSTSVNTYIIPLFIQLQHNLRRTICSRSSRQNPRRVAGERSISHAPCGASRRPSGTETRSGAMRCPIKSDVTKRRTCMTDESVGQDNARYRVHT